MQRSDIDPVTFEVIQNGLDALVDEMALTVMRTAYSSIVKDALDYSTALCDREGRVIAQGLTIVMHLGSFPSAVASVLRKFEGRIYPEDLYILNDPYTSGGIHLPDVYIIKPIFHSGELEAFVGVVAHQTDIGGLVPGSNSTESTEIYQEGLRIPTLKMHDRGEPVEAVYDFIQTNVRLPEKVMGDMRAQIAADVTGEIAYLEMADRYGPLTLRRYSNELLDYSERLARVEIEKLPNGRFEFESYIDADNIDSGSVRICTAVTIEGDEITIDLTGSSEQVPAGINSPLPFSSAAAWGAVRLIMDPGIPNATGYQRPIKIVAPEGTVVNPVHPAPCAARGITGFRIMDTVLGALAQAVPDRVPADGEGGNTIISIGGYHEDHTPFAFVDLFAGARGGRPHSDGPDGVPHPASNIACTPIEIAEAEHPVRIERYGLLDDTGGAGKYRGSLAHIRQIKNLSGAARLQLRSDKRAHPPFGLFGGASGRPSMNILQVDGTDTVLPTMTEVEIPAGGVIRHEMASGAGWGNPMEREPSDVLEDVLDDKVSIDSARDLYGVEISGSPLSIGAEATMALRQSMG